MRLLGSSRRNKSTSTLPAVFSDTSSLYAPFPRESQQGTLALPTRLDDVANSVHDNVPQQLPGDQASEDDVRYFLYQILTLKDYKLASKSPQWVLETCMLWQGDGNKLKSLPLDSFNQLCPLRPGYAAIDWNAKGSKFVRQQLPPCGIRDEIGQRIKNVVEGLKRKEDGHRGPGWQKSADFAPATAPSRQLSGMQPACPPLERPFMTSPFAPTPAYPIQTHFYSLGNQSVPIMHQVPSSGPQQAPPFLHRQPSLATLQHNSGHAVPLQQLYGSQSKLSLQMHGKSPAEVSPVSSSASPISSCHRAASTSSRISASTARTSPPSSESGHPYCTCSVDRSPSIRSAAAVSQFSSTRLYQSSLRDTSTVMPSRYRSAQSLRPNQYSERAFHPAQHMAHLRSSSYTGYSPYAWSEASLTPSDSATEKYRFLRDGSVCDETTEHSLRRRPSFYTAKSHLSRSSTPQSFVTALPYPQVSTTSRLGTATPIVRGQDRLVRPMNNYKVDSNALEAAEYVGLKSSPGPIRSMVVDEERRRNLSRAMSDAGPRLRTGSIVNNTPSRQEPVGPLLRFQNPRTGEPRLTIYETIERKEKLGKQPLENQRRVETQQLGGQLKTVYETIEEQELLDGKPQRGLDICIKKGWGKYF